MSGKWFANRGQILQTVAATVGTCVGVTGLYFLLKANNSLPRPSLVLYVSVAVLFLLIGIFIGRKSKAGEPVEPTKVDERGATAIGGSSTATGGNVHIVFPPSVAPAPVAAVPSPSSKPKIVQLEALPLITKWIYFDKGRLTFGRRERESGPALLLPFYFDAVASDSGIQMEYARAHLVFNDSETGTKTTVDHGFWINATLDYVEISPGERKYLVVAVLSDDLSEARAISSNVTDYRWYSDTSNEPFDEETLALADYTLQVVVSWSGSAWGKRIFEVPVTLKNIPKPSS